MSKSGFVALIGRPNVGKSTILNRLIGQKIAIVSEKPQTTRNRILGVLTREDCQTIFVDTPGIHRPGYRLNKRMMEEVYDSLNGVDLVVQVVDVSESYGKGEEYVLDLVKKTQKPTILALNKVDLVNKGKILPVIEFYSRQFEYCEIIPLSATMGDNVESLEQKIKGNLPEREFPYPHEYVTDQQERFLVSEIIREKLLHHTRQELPYSTAVLVEEFDESERQNGFARIVASIIVDKDSQKGIVIGRGGRMIRRIGTDARLDIQNFLAVRKVYLDLNVKVISGWRNQERLLDELGVRSGSYTDIQNLESRIQNSE
ncbi:GTPase Era [Acidobacteria bacterium AH-259-O06]|nr:GTPase Era [Acidobacteria bacterium AH-259-O06]